MARLFDFDAIRALFKRGFTHALRRHERGLRPVREGHHRRPAAARRPAPSSTPTPLEDFGGHHPDPNPVNAAELVAT